MLSRTSIPARLNICDCLRWCRFINVYRTQTTIQWINRRQHCRSCVLYEWSRSSRSILSRRLTSCLFIGTSGILYYIHVSVHVRETLRMLIVEPRCCLDINISTGSSDADETSYFVIRAYNSFSYSIVIHIRTLSVKSNDYPHYHDRALYALDKLNNFIFIL